ncbi:hypothetical protein CDAR_503941 [Caerostris darwini]|uniref:AF4/FMR2 family member lilli n=1 Tax=Caerostris darwini TaxID=1538125 RepID=A0AAV4PGM4_9ARAC|nr:hypothetical protein CDAR_503941 [Caerostris darwini]
MKLARDGGKNREDRELNREKERKARKELLDDIRDIREPSPQPIFTEPVKVEEDETSRRIRKTLGDFSQVLINDKGLIGISSRIPTAPHQSYAHSSSSSTGYSSSSMGPSSYPGNGYSTSSTHHPTSSGSQTSGYTNTAARPYAKKQPPPPYGSNTTGGAPPKRPVPNYAASKAPDKRQNYNRPEKPLANPYFKPESPAAPPHPHPTAAPRTYHSSNTQQNQYHGQETRTKDPLDRDANRTNSLAVNTAANVDTNANLMINNSNVSTNTTSAPNWNCGPDTSAGQIAPYHLPATATPSPSAKANNFGQTSSCSSMPSIKQEIQTTTPAKRNTVRPSSLKFQSEISNKAPAVEVILEEMIKVVPPAPLTAIHSPRTEETGFAFPTDPKIEESTFLKLEETVQLITPLDDDPMPNDVRQSSPNSLLEKSGVTQNTESAAVVAPEVAPPVAEDPMDTAQTVAETEPAKYVSSSLQDDLEMSDSDDEEMPEVKKSSDQPSISPAIENPTNVAETSAVSTNNVSMDSNSGDDSSNSSSSDNSDSDSDDSSSESNDSDSSSEASDEEISKKKWGLSNFVDESQRIHSPAFFGNDPAAMRLHAERFKNFNLPDIKSLTGNSVIQNNLPSVASGGIQLSAPDVTVSNKSDILLSPIPSPIHPTVGPRTPPSPPKQNFSETNDKDLNFQSENKSSEGNDAITQGISPRSDEPQVNCDTNEEKIVQNEKNKKQLRSAKTKVDELTAKLESAHLDSSVSGLIEFKDVTDRSSENKGTTAIEKDVPDSVTCNSKSSENYSIKTRQRVSAESSAKKLKSDGDNSGENNQNSDVAIAKLKHPRACRKSTENQNKKTSSNASTKSDLDDCKKQPKQEVKQKLCEINKDSTKSSKIKTISKGTAKSQNKIPKSVLKPTTETKKLALKKKKKKFSVENFVQSPEKQNSRLSFSPSPERSPIPDDHNKTSETAEELPARTAGRPSSKSSGKVLKAKKVEKLRRSARCSERATNNVQGEAQVTTQPTSENTKNSKTVGKEKHSVENLSIPINPPVELLSPIPQDPPIITKVSDSAIPRKNRRKGRRPKILVVIPLNKILRMPVKLMPNPIKKTAKSSSKRLKTQKKISEITAPKCIETKDLNKVKNAKGLTMKNKNNTKNIGSNKKRKTSESLNETTIKSNFASELNKNSVKSKDKELNETIETPKLSKKRKCEESREKQVVKKAKLQHTADEKKLKEPSPVIKTEGTSNQPENLNKSKGLERCDSTGSLSSLCSQQSQRSSKSSKEKRKECPSAGTTDAKRNKPSLMPLLSTKEIKQEKEDKSPKPRVVDGRNSTEKSKLKLNKPVIKDIALLDQFGDDWLSSPFWDEGKLLSNLSLEATSMELTDWDKFPPEMHKELKGASTLNKHNNEVPIMPMDYYLTEGKKQLALAEKEKDPFHHAVKFFDAVILFILTSQQREEYSKDTDAVYGFYSITLKLTIQLVKKIRHLQSCPGGTEFKLLILCLKSMSLLNVKHYSLKIKEIKEQGEIVSEYLKHNCSAAISACNPHQSRVSNITNVPSTQSPVPSTASNSNVQNNISNSGPVNVPQNMFDLITRQHYLLSYLHKGHDLWDQADMYMTRSNLREFFKEVADQSEPLTLHSSITELVKYIQKGISLVKKSLR